MDICWELREAPLVDVFDGHLVRPRVCTRARLKTTYTAYTAPGR